MSHTLTSASGGPSEPFFCPCEQAHEALRPGSTKPVAPAAAADVGDISALIASEVAELKDVSKQAFYYHNTGVNSVVYVEFKDPGAQGCGGGVGGPAGRGRCLSLEPSRPVAAPAGVALARPAQAAAPLPPLLQLCPRPAT